MSADELLDSSRFTDLGEQYTAICGASKEVMTEVRMKISPELKELKERLSTWEEGDVREWDCYRSTLGYKLHIYDNCHFCKISCGGSKAYQVMKNGKWEAACNCCQTAVQRKEEVPRPNCQCALHFKE